jgi:hypothetical protein
MRRCLSVSRDAARCVRAGVDAARARAQVDLVDAPALERVFAAHTCAPASRAPAHACTRGLALTARLARAPRLCACPAAGPRVCAQLRRRHPLRGPQSGARRTPRACACAHARTFPGKRARSLVRALGWRSPAPPAARAPQVGESVALPLKYYNNNLVGTLNLLESMGRHNCKRARAPPLPLTHARTQTPTRTRHETTTRAAHAHPSHTHTHTPDRLLQQRHRVRRPRLRAHHGGVPAQRHQPVRPHKAVHRRDAARPVRRRQVLDHRAAALLQPRGLAPQRAHRGGPCGHPQQPDAVRAAGCGGAARGADGVRQRLRHRGRHGSAGLHPRGGPGGGARGGAAQGVRHA